MTRSGIPRRAFVLSAAGVTAAGVAAAVLQGCKEAPVNDRQLVFPSLDEALRELDRLAKAEPLKPATAWSWPQTLDHCAQSIEYSMTGFPQAKSQVFQRTVGTLAFNVFAWRGRMSHDLAEPIPGAPPLDAASDGAAAGARLLRAVQTFQKWTDPLRPHFAYGALGKAEYARAHAMHLANHFSVFDTRA